MGLVFILIALAFNAAEIGGTGCQYEQERGDASAICRMVPRHDFNDPVLNQRHLNQVTGLGLTEAQIRERAAIEYRLRLQEGDTRVVPPGTYADADAAAEGK